MQIYLVGGAVRDMVLQKTPHDRDYVVFGATVEDMLQKGFKQVGKDFPVFLHPESKDEYALARKEEKIGDKHTSFRFTFGPDITPQEDVVRRDFTCNALLYDENTQKIIDLVGGVRDIENKIIRHINAEHFIEDPLRVLRMCRFAAKLNFAIAPETMDLAKKMVQNGMLNHLTAERIWKEFETAMKTVYFDKFIIYMRECGALKVILPEIDVLWQIPERTDYHPEGNSGAHTLLVLHQGANLSPLLKYALLLHDSGKAKTPPELWPHHHGHDREGRKLVLEISQRLKVPHEFRDFAVLVAENHMKLRQIPQMNNITLVKFIRRLSGYKHWQRLLDYIRACRCDMFGRAKEISAEQIEEYSVAAASLIRNYRIQRKICAQDMPDFYKLPKDKNFLQKYNEFRAKHIV
ncbi:MAG: HD domain-containing protein [Alphaproteobacteria bacterium]|nr:HD domain-containing protein [Alphaproteobacteria bacterium]